MAVYHDAKHEPPRWLVDFIHADTATGKKRRIRRNATDAKGRPAKSQTAAEACEARIRDQLARGVFEVDKRPVEQTAETPTLAAYYEKTYAPDVKVELKPQTFSGRDRLVKRAIFPVFGDRPLNEIDEAAIADFRRALHERQLSAKSINNTLSDLRTILAHAAGRKVIATVPAFKWQRLPPTAFQFFDHDQAAKLVAHAPPLVIVGVRTGMRIGELLELKWGDVSLTRKTVTVARSVWWEPKGGPKHVTAPKNHKERTIPLSGEALAALESISGDRHRDAYVFVDAAGTQLTPGACKWPLWRAEDAAGLPRTGPHVLRHTFASLLVMNGVSIAAVQQLMGHSTIQMTMKYAHLAPDHLKAAIATLA